eukprot:758410-Hanusia_phi.AAC.1
MISESVFTQVLNLPEPQGEGEGPVLAPSAFSKLADNVVAAPAVVPADASCVDAGAEGEAGWWAEVALGHVAGGREERKKFSRCAIRAAEAVWIWRQEKPVAGGERGSMTGRGEGVARRRDKQEQEQEQEKQAKEKEGEGEAAEGEAGGQDE